MPPLTDVPSREVPQTGVHLYHFSQSYYSQLARLVLEEKGVSWTSHPVLILAYEQYSPAYVRINPRCVVPTLVIDGKVTTDTYNICRVVNAGFGGSSLIPDDPQEKACVEAFSRLQKSIFVEALSYGDVPDFTRPWYMRRFGGKNHANKALILRRLIAKHRDDTLLKEAYAKKLDILEFTESTLHSPQQIGRSCARSIAPWIGSKHNWPEARSATVAGFAGGALPRPISSGARCCAASACLASNRQSWRRDHIAPDTEPGSSRGPHSRAE